MHDGSGKTDNGLWFMGLWFNGSRFLYPFYVVVHAVMHGTFTLKFLIAHLLLGIAELDNAKCYKLHD